MIGTARAAALAKSLLVVDLGRGKGVGEVSLVYSLTKLKVLRNDLA